MSEVSISLPSRRILFNDIGNLRIQDKFDKIWVFTSSLDVSFAGASIAIIMNNSLACHIAKVVEVFGQVILVCFLFKGKLLVMIISLYVGVSSVVRFEQALEVNSVIANAVNSSTFVVLGGDFNENELNTEKILNYIFVSKNLLSAVAGYSVNSVSAFFDTDYKTIMVLIRLGEFLNVCLNSLYKQANKDCWKFKIKDANNAKWLCFKECSSAKFLAMAIKFSGAQAHANVDDIVWSKLDSIKAAIIADIIRDGQRSLDVLRQLSSFHKTYRKSKIYELKLAEKILIQAAIERCMEKFCSNKGSMIRSVLDHLFCKMVLNHLVVDNELVLEPEEVKFSYAPLSYVNDNAFLGMMDLISISKLILVIKDLFDSKSAGLFGIFNELWKHYGNEVVGCLLSLLNTYLKKKVVSILKVLFKILLNRISFICSKFGVFYGNNFLVLKDIFTQSPVFTVGSVIENALEKNKELWLVLQDMHKAYNSVGWHHLEASLCHIKMCDRFIEFFGGIHKDRFNKMITDFGLSDSYRMHDGLDQDEIFSLLLWRIFYDPLLCKIKRHEHLCRYWINTKFVVKTNKIENSGRMFFFFTTGAFVNNMIWVEDCQASMQYALNIASKFFLINDIFINNKKTVAIPINQNIRIAFLSINSQPISIVKKGEAHKYLEIFLLTDRLSKLSLAKTHSDVQFFVNMVLRKAITNKQFSYLVSAWDVMVKKGLKSKTCLSCDFSSKALHHPSLYGLKFFEQVQSENKVAATLLNPLQFPVKLLISPVNNFLAGVVRIFLSCELSLVNNLPCAFHSSVVFGNRLFDKKGGILKWKTFCLSLFDVIGLGHFFSYNNILVSERFAKVHSGLLEIWSDSFDVYIDDSLKFTGSVNVVNDTAAYFLALDMGIGVGVHGLLSSTMAELQTVVLSLECVFSFFLVVLHLDSQAAIDACLSEISFDDLFVYWVKVKEHSGIPDNIRANVLAGEVAGSSFILSARVHEHFLMAKNSVVSSNTCHDVVPSTMLKDFNWHATAKVWHSDLHMLAGFTNQKSSGVRTYMIKVIHKRLPIAVRKRLYDKNYPSVLCLLCGEVELPDHVFICACDISLVGVCNLAFSTVLKTFVHCASDISLYSAVYKEFVLKVWYMEAVEIFDNKKKTFCTVVDFVRHLVKLYWSKAWLVRSKYKVNMEKAGLVKDGSLISDL
ncbi:hypothetical protein G9A89_013047 [Geosiphon pyriformis]|nr:hypothetical protein G9A89_013047 [Geosiphon pyriformis]